MKKENILLLVEGMIVYINSIRMTNKMFGATTEMQRMVRKYYIVDSLNINESGVRIISNEDKFTFHILDLEFICPEPEVLSDDEEQFFILSEFESLIDPKLFID